jgi:hypothetical protein
MDASHVVYELTITETITGAAKYTAKADDGYTLVMTAGGGTSSRTSTGTVVSNSGTTYVFKTSKNEEFGLEIDGSDLKGIDGKITFDGESTPVTFTAVTLTTISTEVTLDPLVTGYFQSELAYYPGYGFVDDGFEIDAAAKTFYYYMDSTTVDKWGGTIVALIPQDDAAGEPAVLIVKVTTVEGSWSSPPPEVGKYFAVAYKNPTTFAVYSNQAQSASSDAKNTGVDTIVEAISEYTAAKGYYGYLSTTLYYPHTVTAAQLGDLKGNWENIDMGDYFINIRGTAFNEFMDGWDLYDGIYDPIADVEDMIAEMGDIVDCTDTSQASGILYVKVIGSDMMFTAGKYVAVAWKNKSGNDISFATNNYEQDTLAAIKTNCNNPNDTSQFPDASFYDYERR